MANEKNNISVSISDDTLKGVYSNSITIAHNREEFVLDCLTIFPPKGIIGARIIVSPAHAKRLCKALQDNIARYEKMFGGIPEEAMTPPHPLC